MKFFSVFMKATLKRLIFSEIILVTRFFSKREKRRLILLISTQISLSILDLAAISLVGLIGFFALNGVGVQSEAGLASSIISLLMIDEFSFQTQTAILATLAASLLVVRTLLSMLLSYRTLNFLSLKSAQMARTATTKYLSSNYENLKSDSRVNTIYTLTEGIDRLVSNGFGSYLTLISDFGLLLILIAGLSTFDIQTSILVFLVVFFIGATMHVLQKNLARNLGAEVRQRKIQISDALFQLIDVYRELTLRGSLEAYTSEIGDMRREFSRKSARLSFFPNTGKYVLEIAVVVAALIVSAFQFTFKDAPSAIISLITFLAVGSRVIPAVARIQSNLVTLRSVFGASANTIELLSQIKDVNKKSLRTEKLGGGSLINFSDVSFQYLNSEKRQISNLTFEICKGETVALVGRSGAGKSTVFDLILGFANPLSGLVTIDGQSPKNYVDMNPGKIALVPQEVDLLAGTLKSNILLGLPSNPKNVERIKRILGEINLSHFYEKLDSKFDQNFSTSTIQMSGGEKQRIGIARALITNPDIVLLDEATSSLDSLTEKAVTDTLSKLRSTKTIIIIAHRLSTAKSADKIIYLDHGKLIGVGKFEELRKSLPEFAKQAELLGL